METITETITIVDTLKLLALLWGGLTIAVTVVGALLSGVKGFKYSLVFGIIVGCIVGNLVIAEKPYGWIVITAEVVAWFLLLAGVVLASAQRHHIFYGVGESHERGPSAIFRPETPLERGLIADGHRRRQIAEGQASVLTAGRGYLEEQRYLEEDRHQRRLAELERLLLEEGRHE